MTHTIHRIYLFLRRPNTGLALLLMLCSMMLTACKKDMIFPVASGRPYEVLVVIDNDMWQRPAGRAIFDVLDTDVPGLPQSERSFRISQSSPKDFNRTLNIFRNIILIEIDPTQYSQTKMKFTRDKYAMEQIVLTFHSPSEESLAQFCREHRMEIVEFLTKTEMQRLVRQLEKKHSGVTADLASEIFDCTLYAPEEIKSYKKGQDFLWTSNNTATGMVNICMYSYPYEGPETFNKEYILAKRDSAMKVNLPGSDPSRMWMETDTLCTVVTPIVVHNAYAMEARGLWYMRNDGMGGPFVSHHRVDTKNNRVIVVEGFVFAPEKQKRGLMRRLEGSLYTLQLPEEKEAAAIALGVEEEKKLK